MKRGTMSRARRLRSGFRGGRRPDRLLDNGRVSVYVNDKPAIHLSLPDFHRVMLPEGEFESDGRNE
jgi:hypothetical protein